MNYTYKDIISKGEFRLLDREPEFDRSFYQRDRKEKLLTIAWNAGPAQTVTIDDVKFEFPAQTVLPLMVSQSFSFAVPENVVAWQYNRSFYCIVEHDKEVSCVGFLFYGASGNIFVRLDERDQRRIFLLKRVMIEEFATVDTIQKDMLQVLLKRLIIIITRLAKQQSGIPAKQTDHRHDILRHFNLLVEKNYRTQHQVNFYAGQLSRSPKTLANLFARYSQQPPVTIIKGRISLEARRLLLYTDKSVKEIAEELGFSDGSHFSNFFKREEGAFPSQFRQVANSKSTIT